MNQLQAVALNEGLPLQEEVVAGSRTRTTGGVPVSTLGEPAPARPAGDAGPHDPTIAKLTQAIEEE